MWFIVSLWLWVCSRNGSKAFLFFQRLFFYCQIKAASTGFLARRSFPKLQPDSHQLPHRVCNKASSVVLRNITRPRLLEEELTNTIQTRLIWIVPPAGFPWCTFDILIAAVWKPAGKSSSGWFLPICLVAEGRRLKCEYDIIMPHWQGGTLPREARSCTVSLGKSSLSGNIITEPIQSRLCQTDGVCSSGAGGYRNAAFKEKLRFYPAGALLGCFFLWENIIKVILNKHNLRGKTAYKHFQYFPLKRKEFKKNE